MWTLLKSFLLNNRLVRYALLLLAGIIICSFYFSPKLSEVKGKNKALDALVEFQRKDIKALNAVVFELAKRENIRIENNIDGVKLKRGSSLVFTPESKAELTKIDTSHIGFVVDSVTLPKQRNWFGRNISSIFRKKE